VWGGVLGGGGGGGLPSRFLGGIVRGTWEEKKLYSWRERGVFRIEGFSEINTESPWGANIGDMKRRHRMVTEGYFYGHVSKKGKRKGHFLVYGEQFNGGLRVPKLLAGFITGFLLN